MSNTITYSLSQRGKRMAIFQNFTFNYLKIVDGFHLWRCKVRTCHSKLKTDTSDLFVSVENHNHEANPLDCERILYRARIKEQASNVHTPSSSVFTSVMEENNNINNSPILPSRRSSLRLIQRKRNSLENFVSINCPDIPNVLHLDRQKNLFLLFDSQNESDQGRFVIFSHSFKRENYNPDSSLLIDGTFKMAPQGFYQMIIIKTKIFNRFYPLAYILLTNKQESLYFAAFSKLKEIINLTPFNIITDFEFGLINSITKVFETGITGCFFHFSQMIWRKIQNLGLVSEYKENLLFKKIIKKLILLSFCSESTYIEEFNQLSDQFCENFSSIPHLSFLEYFKKNFIQSSDESLSLEPRFPFSLWSARFSVFFDIPYTNNILESWNNYIRKRGRNDHPNIGYLISLLLDLETDDKFHIIRALNGIIDWTSNTYQKTSKLKIILENELKFNKHGFLEALSQLYSFDFN